MATGFEARAFYYVKAQITIKKHFLPLNLSYLSFNSPVTTQVQFISNSGHVCVIVDSQCPHWFP